MRVIIELDGNRERIEIFFKFVLSQKVNSIHEDRVAANVDALQTIRSNFSPLHIESIFIKRIVIKELENSLPQD